MKKIILLSFTLLITMGLWAQTYQGESEEVRVKPPKFAGVSVEAIPAEHSIENYIAANMQYPKNDLKYRIEGTEVVQFTVHTDGTLSDFEVINSVSVEMDREIIRVLKTTSGEWQAGTNNEGPVEMQREVAVMCKVTVENSPANRTDFKEVATNYFKKGSKLLYVKDRAKRALNNFNEGIRYLPYDAGLLVMRGYAKFALGDEEGAILDWRIAKAQTGVENVKLLASTYNDLDGYTELLSAIEN